MDKLEPNPNLFKTPNNESEEHFCLKQLAKIFLKAKYGCRYVGSEVFLGVSIDYELRDKYPDMPFNEKKIVDAVGVQEKRLKHMNHKGIIRSIEVKVSRSDFSSGYNTMADYNYIMAPEGLLEPVELSSPIGLIEVDLDNINVYYDKDHGIITEGVNLNKYPRRLNDSKYIAGSHQDYVNWVIRNIAYKQTNRDIYKNPWIWWEN